MNNSEMSKEYQFFDSKSDEKEKRLKMEESI